MGYQATIEKQGMWAIFDIKGDASVAAKRVLRRGWWRLVAGDCIVGVSGQVSWSEWLAGFEHRAVAQAGASVVHGSCLL